MSKLGEWKEQPDGWYVCLRYPLRTAIYDRSLGEVIWAVYLLPNSHVLSHGVSPTVNRAKEDSERVMDRVYRYMDSNAYFGDDFWGTDLGIDILSQEAEKVD